MIVAVLALAAAAGAGEAEEDVPPPVRPPEAEGLLSKLTASAYVVLGHWTYDVNWRRKFGPLVGWVGDFIDPKNIEQGRFGAEYDYQRPGALLVPTLQIGTNGLVAGQLYSEIGGGIYAIAGVSRTNLRPFYNLSWDPNESVQVGAGLRVGEADRLAGFTIADVRLHTSQQDTHVIWRHHLGRDDRLTLDGLYKSGREEGGRFVRGVGLSVAYDRRRAFARVSYDPHVNFTSDDMVRLAGGWRF